MTGNPTGQKTQLGILVMVAAIFNLAVMEAAAKWLTTQYPVEMVAWARYSFHFLFALPFFLSANGRRWVRTKRPVLHGLRSMFLLVATFAFITSLKYMPLAEATALVFTAPLIVTAVSPFILGEPVGIRRVLAVVVGFFGVIVIIRPGPDFDNWAALLPLAAGFLYAFYQISTRYLSFGDHAMTLFFYTVFGGFLVTSVIVPFNWVSPSTNAWAIFILTGIFGFMGQYLLIRAFKMAEASVVSPFLYTQLIWASLFGFALFGEVPDQWTLIGATIIILSGLYIWNRERKLAARSHRDANTASKAS